MSDSLGMDRAYYNSLPPVNFDLMDAKETDVIYKLFTNSNENEGKLITTQNVANENLNKSIPTILFIHGWTTDDSSPWYLPLKQVYFHSGAHNIIYINWSKAGNKSYDVSSANVKPTGKYIAEFLISTNVPQQNIHLIGHSLGSHLASFIGKYMKELTGKKIGRITALDPAGPKFEHPEMTDDKRLCKNDADLVDVIHTDIDYYGYSNPIGHVDWYPNGGKIQPGCPTREIDDNCCHARSTQYFIESVATKVYAREASIEYHDSEILVKVMKNGKTVIFGQHVDLNARGVYHFETNSTVPYLKRF